MTSDHMDDRFEFMMRARTEKPRENGITMVLGEGLYSSGGLNYLEDLLAVNGAWVDWYKFVWSAFPLQPPSLMERKLELLEENDVRSFTGGNFFEAAILAGYEDEFLDAIADTGCPGIEVSTTIIDADLDDKARLIEKATDRGLEVHGEIGRKASETGGESLTTEEIIEDMEVCMDAGAEMVVLETEEIEDAFDESDSRKAKQERQNLTSIIEAVGQENIVFELPISPHHKKPLEASGWFIETIGPDVNLGNVIPAMVSQIEQQRRGIGALQGE